MKRFLFPLLVGAFGLATAAEPAPQPPRAETEISADTLYEAGKELFDSLAPDEVKAEFEFPDRAQWDGFVRRLQGALEGESLADLVRFEPEARNVLALLRQIPGSEEYQDWLAERLDYIEVAREIVKLPPAKAPAGPATQYIPEYDRWVRRIEQRARPPLAGKYVPPLQPVFATGGVPGQLVWLAEVESSFNPNARSPSGARGLFQLMPATARELGLSTTLPDERTDPLKSAQAAARMLHGLHAKFGDWPLAIAAYNAGAGRVQRTLDKHRAKTFADIAPALSVETRLYVPKVLAVLKVRSGFTLAEPSRR